ncbi:MAG: alpha/beta fold hydrolase [Myxococcota bacterium]
MVSVAHHEVTTPDGWTLRLERALRPGGRPAEGPPVLFVPGYGMNGNAFGHHPTGPSYREVLLEAGLDPWSADLRGTSTARGRGRVRLRDQAFVDLPALLGRIAEVSGSPRVHAIGCSLGGSLLYALAARREPRLDRLVAVGAPLRWSRTAQTRVLARALPTIGAVPMRGTRRFARHALPVVARAAPWALRVYLNPRITGLGDPVRLTRTVEDPVPSLNRAIGAWMRAGDLQLDGVVVREALAGWEGRLLVVHGSGDGIVPASAALSAVGTTAGPVEVVRVTHPDGQPVGHADLFVSDVAPEGVFAVTARFLTAA